MIKSIEFKNFRNLEGKYEFNKNLTVIVGKNNSGKTNLLDGIKIAFSTITSDYYRISKSDFKDSNDNLPIIIKIELEPDSIPSLNFEDEKLEKKCGFMVIIRKTQSDRYVKEINYLNGSNIDFDILRDDPKIPNLYTIPLLRIEDIYTDDLTTGISNFVVSEEKYVELKKESKAAIRKEMSKKIDEFQAFCSKFNQNLDIEITDPKFSNERVYIVDNSMGDKAHNYKIGSGYKSIANIILNTLSEKYNIILIDEIENHLHPSLIRTLIRELREITNTMIIATTHSAVVINELKMEELLDISGKRLSELSSKNQQKLNIFLHPGRSELILSDNVILVEGYTEELLLNNYLYKNNRNWTIVNVSGVMFEPYIELASFLDKKIIVVSDNDKALSDNLESSPRFNHLKELCGSKRIKLLEIENTLETDLYNNGYLDEYTSLLCPHKKHSTIFIAKEHKKTEIVEKLIENNVNLSDWHIMKDIEDEFKGN